MIFRFNMEKIKILLVEDNIDDAELILMEITNGGFDVEYDCVSDREALRSALKNNWDIVISDYSMPAFSGIEALEMVKELKPNLPFIIVSGKVGESLAVNAMRQGARDYIVKGKLARLNEAIKRELNEANLQRSKEFYKTTYSEKKAELDSILRLAPLGICMIEKRVIKYVNEAFQSITGYRQQELIGKNIEFLYASKQDFEQSVTENQKQINQNRKSVIQTRFRRKDNKLINVQISTSRYGKSVKSNKFISTLEDITLELRNQVRNKIIYEITNAVHEAQNLHELMKYIHQKLKQLIHVKNIFLAIYNKAENTFDLPYFVDENDNYASIPDTKSLSHYVLKSDEGILLNDEEINDLIVNGNVNRIASPAKCWMGIPLKIKNETFGVLVLQDYVSNDAYSDDDLHLMEMISKQIAMSVRLQKNRDALKESEQRFRLLADATNEAVFISHKGICIDANKGACKLLGYTLQEFTGSNLLDFVAPESYDLVRENLFSGYDQPYQAVAVSKSGEKIPVLLQGTMYKYHRKLTRLTTCTDLRAQKKSEAELIAAKEKAEESDRLKSAFLANISHEIRTPMNAIYGFAQLLQDEDYDEESKDEFIDLINTNSQDLLHIIEDLIDISKMESDSFSLRSEEFDVVQTLSEVIESVKVNPKFRKKLGFVKQFPKGKKFNLNSDPDRFKQVFNNLITNACKFTDHGNVHVGFEIIEPDEMDSQRRISFYVKDTGIGIPEEKIHIIFDRFRQVDESHTRVYGGAGLGLTITKKIVELMGGKIWVESELGRGSIFYVNLPYQHVAEDFENALIMDDTDERINKMYNLGHQTNVLVVEDVSSNYMLLQEQLKKIDIKALWAKEGNEAINILKNDPSISLVLMDIQLPKKNGYEITKEIRKFNPDIPIIAQTAYAAVGDRQKSLEAGCNDYLSKPIQRQLLYDIIRKYT